MNKRLVIVIPSFYEKGLLDSLWSLNESCRNYNADVHAIVVINQQQGVDTMVDQFHQNQIQEFHDIASHFAFGSTLLFEKNIPVKKAGVGYARKIGMEAACKVSESDHPIINLDADCMVAQNYIEGWWNAFKDSDADAITMQFEHPLDGLSEQERSAIVEYELHLRYYFRAQQAIGYPHAIQPIGSCMGVMKSFYQKIGGMNTRKAGEDFYFLQKCTLNGNWVFSEATKIYPSARISERVPFGTGKAMKDLLFNGGHYHTYSWKSFLDIQQFLRFLEGFSTNPVLDWNKIPESLHPFLKTERLEYNLQESVEHTSGPDALRNRLFRWFTPFRMMKALHYLRDHHYPNVPVMTAVNDYLLFFNKVALIDELSALEYFRNKE